ncbi:RNA polymerase sigma factor [Marivirga arenosa]|uniref:Sigma-70 family RNA polymerase sigma factor n=1 Tax=Marivirga arenosa TaxID=3059076 RepID=A0AA51ZY67_9BACT|nr:sigma-70 family RNA polymerase sigma factor [Marivirga sp. BKB1-2]WNB18880.1 sigma-70 family RNA polymerase sigma factor [Marivirga sp. BKB1-2]
MSEEVLVSELKAQKESAFEYLYDNYSGAIYGVILRIVKSEDVAQEVLHDSFIKAWKKINSYSAEKGRLYTWLVNISRNASIDKLRSKEIKKTSKTDSVSDNVHKIDNANSTEQSIDGIGLDKVLDKLPEDLRFVIEQMYYKGYTQSEIAEEFDIPLGTVKTRARTAMRSLRELLL